jgi:hypothetical protein
MSAHFETEIDESSAFDMRADWLRPMFGHWDSEDPVSHAILDVVEAQRVLSDAISDDANYGYTSSNAAIKEAIEKRKAAVNKLVEAVKDRDNWPDPKLGRR